MSTAVHDPSAPRRATQISNVKRTYRLMYGKYEGPEGIFQAKRMGDQVVPPFQDIESFQELDVMFGEKFQRLDGSATVPKAEASPLAKKLINDHLTQLGLKRLQELAAEFEVDLDDLGKDMTKEQVIAKLVAAGI